MHYDHTYTTIHKNITSLISDTGDNYAIKSDKNKIITIYSFFQNTKVRETQLDFLCTVIFRLALNEVATPIQVEFGRWKYEVGSLQPDLGFMYLLKRAESKGGRRGGRARSSAR